MSLSASLVIWSIDFYEHPLTLVILILSSLTFSFYYGTLVTIGDSQLERLLLGKQMEDRKGKLQNLNPKLDFTQPDLHLLICVTAAKLSSPPMIVLLYEGGPEVYECDCDELQSDAFQSG